MIIFCDTNIVLEYLQQRRYFAEVGQIITSALQQGDRLFISTGSFYTITYLTEKYLKNDSTLTPDVRINKLRYILNGILGTFMLCNQSSKSIRDGVNDSLFNDLEDSYQAHTAEDSGCDVLLTINNHHFSQYAAHSTMKVMTPTDFIASYPID